MRCIALVTCRNVEGWIDRCIGSLSEQSYRDHRILVVDDASTDNTYSILKDRAKKDPRIHVIHNAEPVGKAANLWNMTHDPAETFNNDDILLIIDGDDWLTTNNAFNIVVNTYQETGCKMSYGSYEEYPSGNRGQFAKQLPLRVLAGKFFRWHPWSTSHLVTARADLWAQLIPEDLQGPEGQWLDMTSDLGYTFPLLELASPHIAFIDTILYAYNTSNPANEHKIDHARQIKLEQWIRSQKIRT